MIGAGRIRRALLLTAAFGLLAPTLACKARDLAATETVTARVTIAPVADEHPWVIAFLTALALEPPAGVEARLDGRAEHDGPSYPEPVFASDDREALAHALAGYEAAHARPPELLVVWQRIEAKPGVPGWQLHFVDRAAGFELDREASARLESGSAGPIVRLQLGPGQRESLASLTAARVGRRVAIAIDDEVVVMPIVRSPISGGELDIWTDPALDPEVAAPALLDRLRG